MPEPIVMCFSGGKDSALALRAIQHEGRYDVVALLTTVTSNYDRVSMHGVRRVLLHQQAASLALPLTEVAVPPLSSNAIYERAMRRALEQFSARGIRRVAFGDIFLEDLRAYRVNDTCCPARACKAVAVERRSGIGASSVAENPPAGWARASSHATASGGTGCCICRMSVTVAAAVGIVPDRDAAAVDQRF